MYQTITGEQAHIVDGLKDNLKDSGFDVITKNVVLKRGKKHYQHIPGEKVYYIEDIENIINLLFSGSDKE